MKYKLLFTRHLENLIKNETKAAEKLSWRLACYDNGNSLVNLLKLRDIEIEGKVMLDCAGGWGGHAMAFLDNGARVFLSDYNDHNYSSLKEKIDYSFLEICRADCMKLPYQDSSFDVILALELIEHIQDQRAFALEIFRLLKPGGICILSTPSRLRSIVRGEEHYKIKFIALLPLKVQKFIAESFFRKEYPFAITEQFSSSSYALRPFKDIGLETKVLLSKGREESFLNYPLLRGFFKEFLWGYMLVSKN